MHWTHCQGTVFSPYTFYLKIFFHTAEVPADFSSPPELVLEALLSYLTCIDGRRCCVCPDLFLLLSEHTDRQTYCIYPHYRNQFTGESPREPGYLSACKWSDCITIQCLYCTLLKDFSDCISLCPLCNKECLSDFDTVTSVLSYIAFDFHKECSHMRWERLQILVDAVAETQDEYR